MKCVLLDCWVPPPISKDAINGAIDQLLKTAAMRQAIDVLLHSVLADK